MIEKIIEFAKNNNFSCLLVHQVGCHQLKVDSNINLYGIDLLVLEDNCEFWQSAARPVKLGSYYETTLMDIPLRLWSRKSFGLDDGIIYSVNPNNSEMRTLAPELVLATLPMSPDFPMLKETYARLAEVLFFKDMTDAQLNEFDLYVR